MTGKTFNLPGGSFNVSIPPNGWHYGELRGTSRPLNLAGKGYAKKCFWEETFTIARAGQGTGKYSISFPFRRRVSFSVIVSCHVEDTSCEMLAGELHAGALGSLVFSWVVPM